MSKVTRKAIVALLLFCISGFTTQSVFAGGATFVPPAKVTKVMERFKKKGFEVKKYFPGPVGLVGIVGEVPKKIAGKNGSRQIVYFIDQSGRYLFSGALIDMQENKELSQLAAAEYLGEHPDKKRKTAKEITAADLESLSFIEQQKSQNGSFLYFFVDQGCPHCRHEFQTVSKLVKEGKLKKIGVRWVPVSLGNPKSTTSASLVLGSGAGAMAEMQKYWSTDKSKIPDIGKVLKGGGDVAKKKLTLGVNLIEKNLDVMEKFNITGVPLGFFVRNGQVKMVFKGYMDEKTLIKKTL